MLTITGKAKKSFAFSMIALFFLASLSSILIAPQTAKAADARVFVDPVFSEGKVDTTFTLNIKVENVLNLKGYQFDLNFDPGILEAVSVAEGSFLKTAGDTLFDEGTMDNTSGSIENVFDVLYGIPGGVSGSGTLASVTFKVIGTGTCDIQVTPTLSDSNAQNISCSVTNGSFDNVTPPTVVSTDPVDAATNANIANNVKATFSDVMDPETIIADNFEIRDGLGNLVDGKITYDAATKTAIFNPNRVLHPKTGYTATIKTGVKDISGNNMVSEKSWSFTTEEVDPDWVYVISLYMEVLQRAIT